MPVRSAPIRHISGALSSLDSAFIEVVKKHDLARVKLLLGRGADINSQDRTPFQSCLKRFPDVEVHTEVYEACSFSRSS
jgi:hypothetical protein